VKPISLLSALGLALALLWTAACSKESKLADHLAAADDAFQKREFEKAKIEYINVLNLDRTNSLAIARLGKIYFAQGQPAQAFRLLAYSSNIFPDDIELREHLALIYARAGGETNRARMLDQINEILARDPGNTTAILLLAETARTPESLANLARRIQDLRGNAGDRAAFLIAEAEIARRRGDPTQTEILLRRAIELDPNSDIARQTYGAFLEMQGRLDEAEEHLKRAAELAPAHSPSRERWVRYLIDRRRFDEAKAELDAITKDAPERVSAWVQRAELALAENDLENAEKLLSRALAQAPSDPEALRALAQLRLAQKRPQDAVQEMQKVVTLIPAARSFYQLALAHLLNEDAPRAEQALKQAVEADPGFAPAALLLADMNANRGNFDDAIITLRDIVVRSPQLERAYIQLLRTERAAGRLEDAEKTARLARSQFPRSPAAALQYGLILRQQKKISEAREVFQEFAQMTTNSLVAVEQLVALDVEEGNFPSAHSRVQQVVERNPNEPLVWLMKSEVHRAERDYPGAEAALRKVLQLDPDSNNAFMSLARIYIDSGRRDEAITELEELLKRKPAEESALALLGILRSERGEFAQARDAYERALKVRERSPLVLNNLAYILSEHFNDRERARALALRGREVAPQDPVLADTLGWIEFHRGEFAEARRLIGEASEKLGNNPEVQFHLGMANYMMGQEEQARAAFQRALSATNQFNGRATAQEYLAVLDADPSKLGPQALQTLEARRQQAPRDVIALSRLGQLYESSANYDKAREAYESAYKLNPQSPAILAGLARLLASHFNEAPRALQLIRSARELAPNNPAIAQAAGDIALAAKDYPAAHGHLEVAARQTNSPALSWSLARAAFALGRLDEAARNAQAAAGSDADPKLAAAAAEFGALLNAAAQPEPPQGAASQIQAALSANPLHGPALFAYARVAEAQGKPEDARDAYERLLGEFPNFTPGLRNLSILYAEKLNNDDKAAELGVRAREAYPRDNALAAALGKAIARRGSDPRYAEQLLTQAQSSFKDDPSLLYHLGITYQALSQPARSREALTRALELDPSAAFAADAKKRLEAQKDL
jgi:tetratricopeptide (TPR) repeat protein